MIKPPPTQPVEDSVPKINDEVAVGEDLRFQRRWWKFENTIWTIFAIIVVLDLCGAFGRGPFANAHLRTPDGSLDIGYERIERFSTPSILTVNFGQNAIRDGKVQLWVSNSLVKGLGNQRIVPQPANSVIGQDGILYTFPITRTPASIEFALSPTLPGMDELRLLVPGFQEAKIRVIIMP